MIEQPHPNPLLKGEGDQSEEFIYMEPKLTKDEKKALRQEEWREKADKERKNRVYKIIAIWSLGGMLLILALWALVAFSTGTTTSSSGPTLTAPKVTSSDFQSNPNPSTSSGKIVTLIEYADFQCPACKSYYPIVKQIQTMYGTRLNFVYRFFPLKSVHQNAVNSAKAAYAAGLQKDASNGASQGKFWEMHDRLFETQDSWATVTNPESIFLGYAKDLGLNNDEFKKDYEAQATADFIDQSYSNDTAMGLNSTPTFFVNNKQIDNPQSLDDFKKLIDEAIK